MRHDNPYTRTGIYQDMFSYMQKKQCFTRAELVEYAKTLGTTETKAKYMLYIMLSPRFKSKRGSNLGSNAAHGHLYYMEKLERKVVNGIKEPQKFRLRWRRQYVSPINQVKIRVNEKELVEEK